MTECSVYAAGPPSGAEVQAETTLGIKHLYIHIPRPGTCLQVYNDIVADNYCFSIFVVFVAVIVLPLECICQCLLHNL